MQHLYEPEAVLRYVGLCKNEVVHLAEYGLVGRCSVARSAVLRSGRMFIGDRGNSLAPGWQRTLTALCDSHSLVGKLSKLPPGCDCNTGRIQRH